MTFLTTGIGQVALSAFFFSIMGLCLKELRAEWGTMQVVFFRSVVSLGLTVIVARHRGRPLIGTRRWPLLLRGTSGFLALWCYVFALGLIPYAEAAALLYTGPVFTAVFAMWFLRESMPRSGWVAIVVCLVGSVLILRPGADLDPATFAWAGGLAALAAGVLSGTAYTAVRACARTETNSSIVFWYAAVSTVVSSVLMLGDFVWPVGWQWAWAVGAGVCAQLGQVFLTRGLRAQQAGTAMTGSFLIIALAGTWGWLLFDERPTVWMVTGGACIVGAIVLLSRKRSGLADGSVEPHGQ